MQGDNQHNNLMLQDNTDELCEWFSIIIDKGQEPLRIDKFRWAGWKATCNKLQQAN